jgi:hypothetical protein
MEIPEVASLLAPDVSQDMDKTGRKAAEEKDRFSVPV